MDQTGNSTVIPQAGQVTQSLTSMRRVIFLVTEGMSAAWPLTCQGRVSLSPAPRPPAGQTPSHTQAFSAALLAHTCLPGADSSALDPPTRAQGSRELTLNTQPRLHCQHSQPRSPHPLTHLLPPVSPRLWGPPRLPSFPPPLPGLDSVYSKMEWSPPVSPPTFPILLSPAALFKVLNPS